MPANYITTSPDAKFSEVVKTPGRVPYVNDSTRNWLENSPTTRVNGKLKPNVILRWATDQVWVHNDKIKIYDNKAGSGNDPSKKRSSKAIMNISLPGQHVPGMLNWSVQEQVDSEISTGSFEIINALQVSTISTTLASPLEGKLHSNKIWANYVANSLGTIDRVKPDDHGGKQDVEEIQDTTLQGNQTYREENIKFRQFEMQEVDLTNATNFPDPAIPNDDDNDIPDDQYFSHEDPATCSGAYYILVNNEIMRVVKKAGGSLYVPPGGRAINGVLGAHDTGAEVTLLGIGPPTGDVVGLNLFNVDDYKPHRSPFRTGACFTSYEGYGNFGSDLKHNWNKQRNYQFTGYWFVTGVEDSLGEDGRPSLRVDVQSPGSILNRQMIDRDTIQRIKNKYGQWRMRNGQNIFNYADHDRNIPGDWVDYDSWDPTIQGAYPLQIKIEFAQNKEFLEHMQQTELGARCLICRQEAMQWLKEHGYKGNLADPPKDVALTMQRQVGRHIYKQSIRVLQENGGPLKTYIRLMNAMALAAWDHPPQGAVDLGQRFTKIPNKLYRNMTIVHSGLCYDGQLDIQLARNSENFDWANPGFESETVLARRKKLSALFETTYDKAPFSQPARDLADLNGAQYWLNRLGYPVFVPQDFPMRPSGKGYRTNSTSGDPDYDREDAEWFLSYGGSIAQYNHSIQSDQVVTQAWTTATTAFQSEFTIASAGTGLNQAGKRVMYGGLSGNKEGLMFTGGVQQTTTVSLDNQVLGLDWDTNPAFWGVKPDLEGSDQVIRARPALYDGSPALQEGDTKPKLGIKRVQETINWFYQRRYIDEVVIGDTTHGGIKNADGDKYTKVEAQFVQKIENFIGMGSPNGTYDRDTYRAIVDWFESNEHYIKFDIWWYAQNNRTWEEYVGAVVGLKVPMKKGDKAIKQTKGQNMGTPDYVIDDKGLQKEVEQWQKKFIPEVANVGNRAVDNSIKRASVRSVNTNLADPRIQPGDIIWLSIPGAFDPSPNLGGNKAPFSNGMYVDSISRQIDLQGGSYSATYSGHKFVGLFGRGDTSSLNNGYDFITR